MGVQKPRNYYRQAITEWADGNNARLMALNEFILKQPSVLDKLRDTEDMDKQIIILKVQAKTCFKGPTSRDKQDAKAAPRAKAKPAARQPIKRAFNGHQFAQAEVVDRRCFVYPNGSPVAFITEEEIGYEGGVALVSQAKACQIMTSILDKGFPYDADSSILAAGTMQQFETEDKDGHYGVRFDPREIEVTLKDVKNRAQPPVTQKCILLHLDGTKIDYKANIIPCIQIDAPEFTDLLLLAYEREISKDAWSSLKGRNAPEAFDALALKVAPVAVRYSGAKVTILNHAKRNGGPDDPWGAHVRASLRIKTSGLDAALRRSNANGLVVHTFGTDGRRVVRFPKDTESKVATDLSKQLGPISFGVVPCGVGYSIRCNPNDFEAVKAAVDSDLTEICSPELMLAKPEQGQIYVVRLVPKALTDIQLCKAIRDNLAWESKPHKVLSRHREYNDHEVFAIRPPPEELARMYDTRSRVTSTVSIELKNQSLIDKQGGWTSMRFYKPAADQARTAKPSAQWGYDKEKHSSWSDASEEDEDEDNSSDAPSWPNEEEEDEEHARATASRAECDAARTVLIQKRLDLKEAAIKAITTDARLLDIAGTPARRWAQGGKSSAATKMDTSNRPNVPCVFTRATYVEAAAAAASINNTPSPFAATSDKKQLWDDGATQGLKTPFFSASNTSLSQPVSRSAALSPRAAAPATSVVAPSVVSSPAPVTPSPVVVPTTNSAAASSAASVAVTVVAAATAHALQSQQAQINSQADAVAAAHKKQLDVDQQLAATSQAAKEADDLLQRQLQGASDALAASGAAAVENTQKVSSLTEMINSIKAETAAQQLAQATFNLKIEADRAATDAKLSTLETSVQEAVAAITLRMNTALTDIAASSNSGVTRMETIAAGLTASAATAAIAAAEAKRSTDATLAAILAQLSMSNGKPPIPAAEDGIVAIVATTGAPQITPDGQRKADRSGNAPIDPLDTIRTRNAPRTLSRQPTDEAEDKNAHVEKGKSRCTGGELEDGAVASSSTLSAVDASNSPAAAH